MMKTCRDCGQFAQMAKRQSVCKLCWNKRQRIWRTKNSAKWAALKAKYHAQNRLKPEWVKSENKRGREYWSRLRTAALTFYGLRCACCGETELRFLTLDHVFGDGAAHRRLLKTRGGGVWKWLKDHGYPSGFQTLCWNCNLGRYYNGGECPHHSQENRVNSVEPQTGQYRAEPEQSGRCND